MPRPRPPVQGTFEYDQLMADSLHDEAESVAGMVEWNLYPRLWDGKNGGMDGDGDCEEIALTENGEPSGGYPRRGKRVPLGCGDD